MLTSAPAGARTSGLEVSPALGYVSIREAIRGLRGREAAQRRRQLLCVQGRGDEAACRPTGRQRIGVAKVGLGTTAAGNPVTGTQVGSTPAMTGLEAGSCHDVTGTEYLDAAEVRSQCDAWPVAGPAKVAVGRTASGHWVTGTSVAAGPRVTGVEPGVCQRVTGTEYLDVAEVVTACGTTPEAAPAKVTVSATEAGLRVSGADVDRPSRVTGDEVGRARRITGSQYQHPEWVRPEGRSGSSVPHKVSVMSTPLGRTVTGTTVARSPVVTGTERGECVDVTGIAYEDSLARYQACLRPSPPTAEKVQEMRTWRGQRVTGASVEHAAAVTGDEQGLCEDVTGTPYVGPDTYAAFCETDGRQPRASWGPAGVPSISGTRLSGDGRVTGEAQEPQARVSGTPYRDVDHESEGVGVLGGPRGGFSVVSPAQAARRRRTRVTGTGHREGGPRITGPLDLAVGLVSGTPEFRYTSEDEPQAAQPRRWSASDAVTGEGKVAGAVITGDAWDRHPGITGTEGVSTRRNPTLRGVAQAPVPPRRSRPSAPDAEPPASTRVTGSAGGVSEGPVVTFSGGSRG